MLTKEKLGILCSETSMQLQLSRNVRPTLFMVVAVDNVENFVRSSKRLG